MRVQKYHFFVPCSNFTLMYTQKGKMAIVKAFYAIAMAYPVAAREDILSYSQSL